MTLPTRTKVTRTRSGSLKFENKRILLEILIKNEGFSQSLPIGFEYNYLGIDGRHATSTKQIDIEIKTYIKPWSLLFNKGWNYHEWIDSLILDLERFGCFKSFIKKIGWDVQLTSILIGNNRLKHKKRSESNNNTSNND